MLPIIITKKIMSMLLMELPVMAFPLLHRTTCLKTTTKVSKIGKLEANKPKIDMYLFYETSYNKIYMV